VVVCGGGCSGIAAAVSAARHGASVVLIERWPTVGGMGANALVNGWHRSDRQKMVIYGLVEESARRAMKHGWIREDPGYPHVHETHWYDPEGMRIVWQRMLDEAGVATLCYLTAGPPVMRDGRVDAVLCHTKRGLRAVRGRSFIDATGDGDLAAAAGVPFEYGRPSDGRVQGMTLIFSLKGIDIEARKAAGAAASADRVVALMRELSSRGEFPPANLANSRRHLETADGNTLWNMLPVAGNALDEEELSRLTALARERLCTYLELWRREMPGFASARIGQTALAMGVRESRRVRGRKTLTAEMVLSAAKHADAIGHGVWMIDLHDPKGSGYTTYSDRGQSNMVPQGQSYHIPLGMCLNDHVANLGVAGRCASSTHEAHSSVRVQTHCMVMGQAVGTCAAMALSAGLDMARVDVPALQRALLADAVYLKDVPSTA